MRIEFDDESSPHTVLALCVGFAVEVTLLDRAISTHTFIIQRTTKDVVALLDVNSDAAVSIMDDVMADRYTTAEAMLMLAEDDPLLYLVPWSDIEKIVVQ